MRQAMLPLFFERNDLHRNMAGRRIELEVVQDRPAQHVRQENVERDRGGTVFARQIQRLFPRNATKPLKPLSRARPSRTRA